VRRVSRRRFLLGLGAAAALLSGGCSSLAAGRTLTLGYIAWDENVANSALVKVLAEERLGYDKVELRLSGVEEVFRSVASGRVDAFLDVWLPNHRRLLRTAGRGAILLERPWYEGQTEYGIAVPDYMRDVRSIADLDRSGARVITGIEPDAVLMRRIRTHVIPAYDLDLKLAGASTPAMLDALERAYRSREPFVFLAWSPHWMNEVYDFHYLEDPKDAQGDIVDGSTLHSLLSPDLEDRHPAARALIGNMRLTKEQINSLELRILEEGDPRRGVEAWLENNEEAVRPWVEAAKRAGGA